MSIKILLHKNKSEYLTMNVLLKLYKKNKANDIRIYEGCPLVLVIFGVRA